MKKYAFPMLLFLLLLLNVSCSSERELPIGLSAKNSVEAVVRLADSGIAARLHEYSSRGNSEYRVIVPSRDYNQALKVLHEYGIAGRKEDNLEEFTRPQGFAPNTKEMSDLRLDYALSRRIEHLLSAMPGVVESRVLVRAHLFGNRPGASPETPTASVVVRYRKEMPGSDEEVQRIVAEAVPGLEVGSVRVQSSRVLLPGGTGIFGSSQDSVGQESARGSSAPLTKLGFLGIHVLESERLRFAGQVISYLLAFCIIGGVIGFIWGAQRTRRILSRRVKKATGGSRSRASLTGLSASLPVSAETGRHPVEGKRNS